MSIIFQILYNNLFRQNNSLSFYNSDFVNSTPWKKEIVQNKTW